MEPEVAGVLSQFKSIKKHASLLRQSIRRDLADDEGLRLKSLVEEFKDAKAHFERIRYERRIGIISLRSIEMPRYMRVSEQEALLREIDIECDKAIGVLGNIATALSKDELDKLSFLREELEKLSEVLPDINYERNLSEAIDEYEKGDYLASALISSRVILSLIHI